MRPLPSTSATSPRRDGAVVGRGDAAQHVGAALGVDPHGAAAAELDADARRRTSRSAASGRVAVTTPVDALGVGRGEDLLGREVREVLEPVGAVVPPPRQLEEGRSPTVRSVPGPGEPDRVERGRVEAGARPRGSRARRACQAATGSGSSRRQMCSIAPQSRSRASSGSRSG